MKVDKSGQVVLTKADYRVGNFVYSNYSDYVCLSDINRTIQTKVAKRTFVGQMLEDAIKSKMETFLHNYAGVMYYLNGIAPDQQFLEETFKSAQDCLERHPELYGSATASDEEDQKIIQEEKELREFEEDVKKLPDEPEADIRS